MNTVTGNIPAVHTRQYYRQKEAAALQAIPGMDRLLAAHGEERLRLEDQYPDAAFACRIVSELFFSDRELAAIHMEAYSALLRQEPIAQIRFHFRRQLDAYHQRHLWD